MIRSRYLVIATFLGLLSTCTTEILALILPEKVVKLIAYLGTMAAINGFLFLSSRAKYQEDPTDYDVLLVNLTLTGSLLLMELGSFMKAYF